MPKVAAWLNLLEARHRHAPIQLGLERIQKIARTLKIDALPSIVITVGGTNGKGSTVKALEALYLASYYQVGTYTSPHLILFNERIRLNGKPIDDSALEEAFSVIDQAVDSASLTYFEFTTLAALWFFKKNQPDIVILEVGMGGRLDATNIIDSDLAIITTVDYDHQAYLGETLEAIGFEKAGILRANKPFIFASDKVPHSVREVATRIGAIAYYMGEEAPGAYGEETFLTQLHPHSLRAAIKATSLLHAQLPIQKEAIYHLNNLTLEGRLQILSPGIIVDVAHNTQSVQRLSAWLQQMYPSYGVHAVFSALGDKSISSMVNLIKAQVIRWHIAPLKSERAATQAQLLEAFDDLPSEQVLWYNHVSSAFHGAKAQCKEGEVVVVFGSFLTVAAVLI